MEYEIWNMEYASAPGHGRQTSGGRKIIERRVGAFARQAVTIKNHEPEKLVLALFGRAFDLAHQQRLIAPHDDGVESALVQTDDDLIVVQALSYQPLRFADALRRDH